MAETCFADYIVYSWRICLMEKYEMSARLAELERTMNMGEL